MCVRTLADCCAAHQNDFSVAVPIEDYWGSSSHGGYSPWSAPVDGVYKSYASLIPLGSIGQEGEHHTLLSRPHLRGLFFIHTIQNLVAVYGAGLAFEAALLAPVYGSATAARPADFNRTWQLTRRVLHIAAGSSSAVDIWPPVGAEAASKGSVTAQGDDLVRAAMRFSAASGGAQVVVRLGAGAKAGQLLETVLWVDTGVDGVPVRPSRVLVVVQ